MLKRPKLLMSLNVFKATLGEELLQVLSVHVLPYDQLVVKKKGDI